MGCQEKKSHRVKSLPSWELLVEECASQLRECDARAASLRVCADYFSKRKASGDTFPGMEQLRKKGLLPADDSTA